MHHRYYHRTRRTAILSVTVRNTFLTAPRIRLSARSLCVHAHTARHGRTHAREETRWSPLAAPSVLRFLSSFLSLSFPVSIALCAIQVTLSTRRTTTNNAKPRSAKRRRTNEAAAPRTNARLCAGFAGNPLFRGGGACARSPRHLVAQTSTCCR